WYLRADIIWHKPNPMPESVTDRPTKAHEYIFLLTKNPRYYYDADAIAEPATYRVIAPGKLGAVGVGKRNDAPDVAVSHTVKDENATRNKRSVWTIATQPYPEAHFATFPEKLVEPCILAGTSPKASPKCGAPWRRVVEKGELRGEAVIQDGPRPAADMRRVSASSLLRTNGRTWRERIDRGFEPTCTCEGNDGSGKCIVLDPFAGSGTTLLVAERLGRQAVGIEINPEYVEMAKRRLSKVQLAMPL